MIVAAATGVTLAVPAVRHLREPAPLPDPPIRLSLTAPPGAELGSGDEVLDAAISPDGRQIVFVATTDGTSRLWRRALDGDRQEPVPGTDGARLPSWKHTGNVVAFFAGDRLKQVSLRDGAIRDLTEASSPAGASWQPDGSILLAPDSRGVIHLLRENMQSDATRLRAGDRAHAFPMTVGSTGAFVYTALGDDGRRSVRLVEGGQERDLATTSGHGQLVGDSLLHVRDNVLLSQRIDRETRLPTGRPVPLAMNAGTGSSGRSLFVASERVLLSAAYTPQPRQLTWFTISGERTATTREPADYWQVRLSPDDRHAAVTATAPLLRTLDILVIPMSEAGDIEPLTFALAADSDPVWSPDGSRVAFRSMQDGQPNVFVRTVRDQDAKDEWLLKSDLDETPTDWQGARVLFHAPDPATGFNVWALAQATGVREKIVSGGFNETDARLSPDGQWIAYVSDESGRPDIYAVRSSGGGRIRVSFAGGARPRWGRDGQSLFFLRDAQIMRSALSGGTRFITPELVIEARGIRDFDVAHRRDALVALMPVSAGPAPIVSVLVDWMSAIP
jgi:Tol biopolymer transport system component